MYNSIQVSVCIPVFNRRDLVGDALRSALEQDVPGYEVIVVDNCSIDGTWEYLQNFTDPRLRLYRNESNIGLYGNFNRCGELAKGEYVLFLCSDDRLIPGFVERALAQMRSHPNSVLLSSRGRVLGPDGHTLGQTGNYFPAGLYDGDSVATACLWTMLWAGTNPFNYPSGALFRADALKKELPFQARFGTPADIDIYLRTLQNGELIVVDEVGCEVIGHGGQYSSKAKQSGAFIDEMLTLLESRRALLASLGAYERFRAQLAASIWAYRIRSKGVGQPANWPSFSLLQMAHAVSARLATRLLWRVGRQRLPYIQRIA